jgi:hypothetical protein
MWFAVAQALTMDGRLAGGLVEAVTQRLAVDGHDLPAADFVQGGDPAQEALLKLGRLDRREDGVEAVVRGNAVAEVQELAEPVAFLLAELGDGDKIVGSTNYGAHHDDHDVDQGINDFTTARVRQLSKVIL